MKFQEALDNSVAKLKPISPSPVLDTEVLLSHVLKKPREFLYTHPDKKLSRTQITRYQILTNKRSRGIPTAYLTGHKEFYGLDFLVNKSVLIPRPETEKLVELALEKIKNQKSKIKNIFDIGTGSGNIIISLTVVLNKAKNLNLVATDISKKALEVARKNARRHKVKVKFFKGKLLAPILESKILNLKSTILIANLPYLAKSWKTKSIKHEPSKALYASEQGLMLVRQLLEQVAGPKDKPKIILLEFDPRQKGKLQKLIPKILPKNKIIFHKDLADKFRFVEIITR